MWRLLNKQYLPIDTPLSIMQYSITVFAPTERLYIVIQVYISLVGNGITQSYNAIIRFTCSLKDNVVSVEGSVSGASRFFPLHTGRERLVHETLQSEWETNTTIIKNVAL